ncbi:MAG TPA: tetratricopeptide repeat protein [Candidatus Angelobacter sp.]
MAMHELLSTLLLAAAFLQSGTPHARPSPAQAQASAAGALEKAEALIQAQQYAQAEEKLQALTATQGKNAQLWFDLGYCQSHQSKTADAEASYRKAVELAPNWFEANLNLGVALAKAGDGAGAATVLRHATELKPLAGGPQAVGKAWDSLAQVLEESDPKASARAYEKASELDPENSDLDVAAGRMLEKVGDLNGAERHFVKSAKSFNARGMALLINFLSREKRFGDAETWLRRYVAQNPQDAQAREQLAKLLAAAGKPQEAVALLEEAGKNSATPPSRELAELYLQAKQYQQAEPVFRELAKANANDAALHFGLGVSLLYQLKYAEAESELLQAVKLKGDYSEAYGYLADAARENKHYELAIRALDARAKYLPENPMTFFIRATSYDSLRMPKQAVENYKRFLAAAGGKYPDQEFQARHRLKAIEPQ